MGALMEVGAAWITQVEHKIFNIYDFRPEHPLDDEHNGIQVLEMMTVIFICQN